VSKALKGLVASAVALVAVPAVVLPGCLEGEPRQLVELVPPPHVDDTLDCVDGDGDGYGKGGCIAADCNDEDATSTDECYRCQAPEPGCPCDDEGAQIACGKVESQAGNQLVCGQGFAVCQGGVYGECIINSAVTLVDSPYDTQGFGTPTTCTTNPCDPKCKTFVDTPTGISQDGGIVVTEAGVTLPSTDAPDPNPVCTGGTSGTCAHSICTTGTKLTAGCDVVPQTAVTLFTESFATNNAGWTLGTEWERQAATASSGHTVGNPDPANDKTNTADDYVVGLNIGGNAATTVHSPYYLTSPIINVSATYTPIKLGFWRWLNSDVPAKMKSTVEVYDGAAWQVVYSNPAQVTDSAWTYVEYDISAYQNANLRVRFGVQIVASGSKVASSWNIDDLTISGSTIPPPTSCVSQICATTPSCCTGTWTVACASKVNTVCNLDCGVVGGACVTCYKDGYDRDGDGYSYTQGDCLDCDPQVNPGAYDFPANLLDEDCSGIVDDSTTDCDGSLALASSSAMDYAKAIDLCQTASASDTGANKKWGVLSAKLVQADGSSTPNSLSYGILSTFGAANVPQAGAKMAAFSSGTARAPGQSGYVNPNGQSGSYDQNKSCSYPSGFPKNASGCPNGTGTAYDSTGLLLSVRTPTNAKSFSYKFNFFSTEYPEWVCTAYNDGFVALLTSSYVPANPAINSKNVSFDSANNPVSVNIGFFTVTSGAKLTGTGMDGSCKDPNANTYKICGGGTDWLQTTAPIVPGETIGLQFNIWDTGDHQWDSIVLMDAFEWSVNPATIETKKPEPPSPPIYNDGWFVRDYDATGVCAAGETLVWGHWSWGSTTPGDSKIEYYVRTASSQAGLETAPEDALQFSNPPGPVALAGTPAIAKASTSTTAGAAVVDTTLAAKSRPRNKTFLRVRSHLVPTTDKSAPPVLNAWNLQVTCVPSE
jgi:hypothetical protein